MKSDRPAHKEGLRPLANDILQIRARYGFKRGAFRKAVETGTAPEWVKNNLTSLENIELKVYNRHLFLENFRLAFQRTGKIRP